MACFIVVQLWYNSPSTVSVFPRHRTWEFDDAFCWPPKDTRLKAIALKKLVAVMWIRLAA